MNTADISALQLAAAYTLLLAPLGILLWHRIPAVGETLSSVARMTVQLLFVGFYLQVVFRWNLPWVNALWVAVMVVVADASVIRGSGIRPRRFAIPLFVALAGGLIVPLALFLAVVLRPDPWLDARFTIPISGMILGNCLRADIIGIRGFYDGIRKREKTYLHALACGASLREAVSPYFGEAMRAALAPTIATMATTGIVSLPGMMTGVILGGADPFTAIKYQIAIMLAIFSGTAITVTLAVYLTLRSSFTPRGVLDHAIFQ